MNKGIFYFKGFFFTFTNTYVTVVVAVCLKIPDINVSKALHDVLHSCYMFI